MAVKPQEHLLNHIVAPVGLARKHEARIDQPVIDDDRARAADFNAAAVLRAREAGLLAKRIANGEPVQQLNPVPVQRVRIAVNQKTARYLGLTIPKELDGLIDEAY